ncbi:50S ribosomal protein L31e [Geodia barretti]|uniref:50S ribosomal protein L31e n=1 Tax=Geodia barretti TaxID=519541 RepID=A0AA35T9F2_GEOBA|nr:50S ribosomal protein L31e [Geodia barretti]
MIKEFTMHHMKTNSVRISEDVAHYVWKRGIKHPPRKIRVGMERTDEGFVLVYLYDKDEAAADATPAAVEPTEPELPEQPPSPAGRGGRTAGARSRTVRTRGRTARARSRTARTPSGTAGDQGRTARTSNGTAGDQSRAARVRDRSAKDQDRVARILCTAAAHSIVRVCRVFKTGILQSSVVPVQIL